MFYLFVCLCFNVKQQRLLRSKVLQSILRNQRRTLPSEQWLNCLQKFPNCRNSWPPHRGMPLYHLIVCPRSVTAEWMFVMYSGRQKGKLGSKPLSRVWMFERAKMRRQANDCTPGVCLHTQPSSHPVQILYFLYLAGAAALSRPGEPRGRNWDASADLWKNGQRQGEDGLLVWSAVPLYRFSHVRVRRRSGLKVGGQMVSRFVFPLTIISLKKIPHG